MLIKDELDKKNYKNIYYIKDKNDIPNKIINLINPNDFIICMGAGKINSVLNNLIDLIKDKYEKN